ncbi:MAG: shikimate dehydrogenase [Acidobacteriota bacterium]|nr:shikimate dehydrogenase [Acidobacteriota bacterium]
MSLTKHPHPRVFVTIAAPTLAAMEEQASNAASSQTGFEWRLDYLHEFEDLESRFHQMLFRLRFPQSIATCRRVEAGGLYQGSIEEQASILEAAVRAGCHWVDLEEGSVKRAGMPLLQRFRAAKIIVSHHDYRAMPALGEIHRRLARLPVQVVKIAAHAHNLADNLKVEKFLRTRRGAGPKVVAFGMGPCGIPSRLLSLKWGSLFTYASAGSHIAVASGQLPAAVMRTVYRVEHLDHRTQIYGIVGSRASISLSPSMQNAAFNAKRINAIYLPCETSQLSDFLKLARQMRFGGFSVTMPYKRAIIKELDWIDPLAEQIGACNTVAVQHGKWMGWNTDAAAVVEVLTKRLRLAGSRILILGAGGAARSAAYALRGEGAGVFIAARREVVARQLARSVSAQVVPWGSAEGLDVDAVVNATPIGMSPNADTVPIDLARLRVRVVLDMVYYPMETRFLAEARGRGITTISGLEMLVDQGARQFEIWTGQSAPRALMEQAVRQGFDHTDMD